MTEKQKMQRQQLYDAVGNPCRVIRPITDADKTTCWDR